MNSNQKTLTLSNLEEFGVDLTRGFLPAHDPLKGLPAPFAIWDALAADLPKLLVSDHLREAVVKLPTVQLDQLTSDAERERAMMILSFIGHAYVWGSGNATPAPQIPFSLAIPWHTIAQRCGRPPVLSYASYALHNWKRINPHGPIELGNIALLQNFLGGIDEEWFILIHVDIEAKAGPLLIELVKSLEFTTRKNIPALIDSLNKIGACLERMYESLARMPEHCDPYIYYNRVRPYIHGWKNHPALPQGVSYEGVTAYAGVPQKFRGETGSQSSIIPAIDAALGVEHSSDQLKVFLDEMRQYMPPQHRAFIEALEEQSQVRSFVVSTRDTAPQLKESYNNCLEWLTKFRSKHLAYAVEYINNQQQKHGANPNAVGTGGTPFVPYLTKHRDETHSQLV